ncbi:MULTISPECIES: TonB-dependent receptor [Myroides]|uniref:TonB-dependent receptor n=1 Tax=Myroides albus TaxID=2562892 RepID=A0A6I3LH27_9FLAO|nr:MULTISPECIES: TonB-dependent receptor [Myroides]MTG97798.1 TonB-dependent receptor [Myroides albus]MVX34870.1 TonB-dependent receptor [Myroides sp. LoEW2-1]UVD79755.1 TonB-dependent receptor [Myroides albus]
MKKFSEDLVLEGDRLIEHQPAISDKALRINLNNNIYGTFAEIGAGQETVRHFFRAGGSSRTIAKAMSAYDKVFSDAIYSVEEDGRYVTESRLNKMLDYETRKLEDRLIREDNPNKTFFSYANTVATIDYAKKNKGHGWIGIKFQSEPDQAFSKIVLHIQFKETDSKLQQETLGILGVNLIYGAYYQNHDPKKLIHSLYDHLDKDQIEIDSINFSGPLFQDVDNRLMSLFLVKNGMTDAVMFGSDGQSKLPANVLYKQNILALRGSFRPVTIVNMDMTQKSIDMFIRENDLNRQNTTVVFEITLSNLLTEGEIDEIDFLHRADLLCSLGQTVMISNFQEYYKLTEYFCTYTDQKIAMSLGVSSLLNIFEEKYYKNLTGGILEALGKLFRKNMKIYLYPMMDKEKNIINSTNLKVDIQMKELYKFFKKQGQIVDITEYEEKHLGIFSRDVLKQLQEKKDGWEQQLPAGISQMIKEKELFGYKN